MRLIMENLRPYTVPLFKDQYGNYVLQCCLKFGAPFNDFIFEAMLSQMWEIAQSRFGARAMRACLESHHSTKDQQRMLAAAIALHSVRLATNQNGALLLTWFLDTCTFPNRRTVLAPQVVPELVHLCTHKVAYLTVLKIINQNKELEGRDKILKVMFKTSNISTLEEILADQACGATLIFKILTTPFFDESLRSEATENIRHVLLKLKAQPAQGYKRLMDEVGLSTRTGSTGPSRDHASAERPRPGSNHSQVNGHIQPPQYGGQFYPQMNQLGGPQPGFDMGMGMQRTDSMDSNLGPFQQNNSYNDISTPMFNSTVPQVSMQQLQYQQQLLARAAGPQMNGFGYPNMQSGFGGYSPAPDPYRNQGMNSSPIQPPQNMTPASLIGQGFAPPGFGMGISGGYGYGMGQMPVGGGYVQQEQQVNGRRGRVC